mmetsp:Transcript_49458/g.115409  ORF Transcript_49458/g.115409 Transcript_49458/m.115409 type:complete len:253 (-) Transcript_49458:32-790(-)
MRRLLLPFSTSIQARLRMIVLWLAAISFSLNILRLCLVIGTPPRRLIRDHSNVMPRCRMPVGVVVPLLRTLQAMPVIRIAVPIWVLSRGGCPTVITNVLVGRVQALLALTLLAIQIELQGLMLSQRRLCSLQGDRRLLLTASSVLVAALGAIAYARVVFVAHILQDHLANHVWLPEPTAVLNHPLNVQLRTLVVGHAPLHGTRLGCIVVAVLVLAHGLAIVANLIAALRVVLRIKKAVLVLRIVLLLAQLVV